MCFIIYPYNQSATLRIGKSHNCFHIFFAFIRYNHLVFNILGFAGKQLIFCHNATSNFLVLILCNIFQDLIKLLRFICTHGNSITHFFYLLRLFHIYHISNC